MQEFAEKYGPKLEKLVGKLGKVNKAAAGAAAIIEGAEKASEHCKKKCDPDRSSEKSNKNKE